MNNMSNNSSLQPLSDNSFIDIDQTYNVNLERSYMMDWTMVEPEEEDFEVINSTQTEAIVPELEHDARPVRSKRRPDFYQAS